MLISSDGIPLTNTYLISKEDIGSDLTMPTSTKTQLPHHLIEKTPTHWTLHLFEVHFEDDAVNPIFSS